ncbi:hypothetical protein HNQ56_000292 [Anaerotaenia torta]|uniref:hypothetical protein n=1 Tax=Anaerotaenia torta TaxID=433293 RepID=UPI003D1A3E0C
MKEISTRKVFFKQLNKELRHRYDKKDAINVLKDYDEFFNIETEQGKSEEEVCAVLGSPCAIAQSLSAELPPGAGTFPGFLSKSLLQACALIAAICAVAAFAVYRSETAGKSLLYEFLLYYPLTALLLWLVLRHTKTSLMQGKSPASSARPASKKFALLLLGLFHLICISSICSVIYYTNRMSDFDRLPFEIEPHQIGPLISNTFFTFILALCAIIILSVMHYHRISILYYSAACHALAVQAMLLIYNNILHRMDSRPDDMISRFVKVSGSLYLELLVILTLFIIFLPKKELNS